MEHPMQILRHEAFARAGVVGNPSDGCDGCTISMIVRNFRARVVLYEWDRLEIVPTFQDQSSFRSIRELANDVELHGYYGGIRLIKATIRKFIEYCDRHGISLHDRNFSIRYESDIPRQVGLAGSSAIIVATLRCLMEFYGVVIPCEVQPSLALSVETEELRLSAGLQDRVIQVYEGVVSMDFGASVMREVDGFRCGAYEPIDPARMPPMYLAYGLEIPKPMQAGTRSLIERYREGNLAVQDAVEGLRQCAVTARDAILSGDIVTFCRMIDEGFEWRRRIVTIREEYQRMIDTARSLGLCAGFTGSGGAIIGVCSDDATLHRLEEAMHPLHCRVIRPQCGAGRCE